ncbi:hypothetical protein LSTR_LSTR003762 [Laodelphax striatellus]|uniref:Serpin domain-containing protein n=1 Tax=Laodelphax striatellus TaxID=195883 RepID=A0A482WQ05_LAOST|nr:hypothetical protein LSTR_LSTR003762 [Laodelphax striatellus]
MMIFLFFLLSCAASVFSEEVVKKIPIFGPNYFTVMHDELGRPIQKFISTPESIYKGVIEKPTLVLYKIAPEEKFSFEFAPEGIAKMLKDPKHKSLHDFIANNMDLHGVVFPKAAFPLHYFMDSNKPIVVPEHSTSLNGLLEDPLFLVLVKKDDFPKISAVAKLGAIGDLELEGQTVRMSKALEAQPAFSSVAPQPTYYYIYPSPQSPYSFSPPVFGTVIPALEPAKIPSNVGPYFF